MPTTPPQIFKSRKAAHDWLVEEGVSISRGKFYEDATRLKMVQSDKSVLLSDLHAYVKNELKLNPVTGQSIGEIDRSREKEAEELRGLRLKNEKLERENRKEDAKWIERAKAYEREGALVTQLMGEIRYQSGKVIPAAIAACKGDQARNIEVAKIVEDSVFEAFRAVYENGEVEVSFEEEEEEIE